MRYLAMLLLLLSTPWLRAEDAKQPPKELFEKREWVLTLGCRLADFAKETGATTPGPAGKYEGKVYLLEGLVTKKYAKGGEWLVVGRLQRDGKTIVVEKRMGKD